MARRNEHSKDELQRLTLKAVKDFLTLYPPQEMSLRKIAKLIGYAPATVINSFGSYGELLLAANGETLDELHTLSAVAIRNENNPQLALRKLSRVYLAYARKYPYRWHLAFEHRIPDQKVLPEWQKGRIDRLFALFTEQLSRTGARKNLQDIHIASRVVWAGVHGICLLAAGGGALQEKHATGEQMLDMFLNNFMGSYMAQRASV
ncbi:TetR/AcrR family transcriptional regulator [Sansalvadorimonas verongulae]|uniref:TetR/AcrR family transcriptional regulator n=1 Tax=Sansalvadorimonas verongulae TaxID=2172824 RepID=UPI0012BC2925|nr:TetR/AcrR family transcriptional regulator [Sansalvadorimonas verongulae]MTI14007.1 TetR/AcrR family transcriptional regulator [Sansalvadorimonas verongulae]